MMTTLAVSDVAPQKAPCPLKGDLKWCIDKAGEIGFDGIEIHARNAALLNGAELGGYAAKNGMTITTIGTGLAYAWDGYSLTHPMFYKRQEAIDVVRGFLNLGARMGGADVMLAIMKGPLPDGADREEYKNILYESLLPCVELAEKLENDLTIEAVNRFECPYLWTAKETLAFVNRFGSERVTVHLDTFHMNIEEKDVEAAIRLCKGKLGHFHVSDNDRRYPGHSRVDFKMCIDTLYDIGYTGALGFEYWADPDGETAARRGLAHIKRFLRD